MRGAFALFICLIEGKRSLMIYASTNKQSQAPVRGSKHLTLNILPVYQYESDDNQSESDGVVPGELLQAHEDGDGGTGYG